MDADKIVDAKGSFCPGPLMELIVAMKESKIGETVDLLSTDQGSAKDVPEWVNKVGHEMIGVKQDDNGVWHIFVRKSK